MEQLLLSYIILFLEIVAIHSIGNRQKRRVIYFGFFFLQFFIFAGFRGIEIHPDTPTYDWHFANATIKGSFWEVGKDSFNRGYLYFEKFLRIYVTNSVLCFNLITSFIFCICTLLLFYKKSVHMGIAIFLYYVSGEYFTQMGVIREALAVMVGYCCISLMSKGKYLYSLSLIIFDIFIHHSAIVLLMLLLLEYASPGKTTKKYIFIFVVGIIFAIAPFFELLFNLLDLQSRYVIEGVDKGYATANGLFNGCVGLQVSYALHKMMNNAEKRGYYLRELNKNIIYLYFLASLVTLRLPIMSRFLMFFNPILFVMVSNMCFLSKKNVKITLFVILVFVGNVVVKQALRPEWIGIFPYYFYSDTQLNLLTAPE